MVEEVLVTIAADDVMPLVLAASPSFDRIWDPEQNLDAGRRLLYIDVAEFVRHLSRLVEAGEVSELPAIAELIERLHVDGDQFVRELATVGFLESLHPESPFVAWLLPESRRWWDRLERFWNGDVDALSEAPD